VSLIRYVVCHSLLVNYYYCRLWLSLLIVPAMCPSSPILPESKSFDCIMCKWNGKKRMEAFVGAKLSNLLATCWSHWLRMCRYASWLLINDYSGVFSVYPSSVRISMGSLLLWLGWRLMEGFGSQLLKMNGQWVRTEDVTFSGWMVQKWWTGLVEGEIVGFLFSP